MPFWEQLPNYSWSKNLVPLKSLRALSELPYHLSLYNCQFFGQWNKISKKEYYLQRIFIHYNILACVPSWFWVVFFFFFGHIKTADALLGKMGNTKEYRKDNDSLKTLFRIGKCILVGLGSFLLFTLLERIVSLWNSQYSIAVVVLFFILK